NTSTNPITTIRPDCVNTTFTTSDAAGNLLDPIMREKIYGTNDLVTILGNAIFSVTCDITEMFAPSILTDPNPADGQPAPYTVDATSANYIVDRNCGTVGQDPCIDIWLGAV